MADSPIPLVGRFEKTGDVDPRDVGPDDVVGVGDGPGVGVGVTAVAAGLTAALGSLAGLVPIAFVAVTVKV